MNKKEPIQQLLKTIKTISDSTQRKKADIYQYLILLYQRYPDILPKCKTFAADLLTHLKTLTENFDQISSKAQDFGDILVCPNINDETVMNDGLWSVNLATPQKTGAVNSYQNMLKEQLFTSETKNPKFDYYEENQTWETKIKAFNSAINRCIEYAEKKL